MVRYSALPPDLKSWTKLALARYRVVAGHRMGQHFLVDKEILSDMVAAARLTPDSRILEVGGGLGVLTSALIARAKRVVVVELDSRLVVALNKIGVGSANLTVIAGDILQVPAAAIKKALGLDGQNDFDIVANLPYEITGALVQRFLWGDLLPRSLTLLIQREVAERMSAKPGQMSLLSLSCQLKGTVKILRSVPPSAFWPPPKVQSSIVRLDLRPAQDFAALLAGQSIEVVWRLARLGFAARRKLLVNNLASALPVAKEKILQLMIKSQLTAHSRAQELSPAQWLNLARAFGEALPPNFWRGHSSKN